MEEEREIMFPTYLDYTQINDGVKLRIYGRGDDGKRKLYNLVKSNPFFYVKKSEFLKYLKTHDIDNDDRIVSVEDSFKDENDELKAYISIKGEKLVKIIVNKPSDIAGSNEDVSYLRNEFEETFEADIKYENRKRIDLNLCNYISLPKDKINIRLEDIHYPKIDKLPNLRIFVFDIENLDNKSIKQAKKGESEIVCITIYDNYTNKYHVFTHLKLTDLDKIRVKQKLVEYWQSHEIYSYMKDAEIEYHTSANENEFLANLLQFIRENYPDIMAGWNSNDYDFTVIYERCKNLGIPLDKLSEVPKGVKKFQIIKINGLLTHDLMNMYDKLQQKTLKFKKLDIISEEELNTKKLPRTSIIEMVQNNIPHLIAYNIIDVQLTKLINDKSDIINFYTMLSIMAHCELGTTHNSHFIDNLILSVLNNKYVLPTRLKYVDKNKTESRFGGGAVHEATAGLHQCVFILDFASLYPSIMRSLNISIETKISDEEFNEIIKSLYPDISDEILYNSQKLIEGGYVPDYITISANGVKFDNRKMGIVPQILEDLTNERKHEKQLMKEATTPEEKQQHNLKQLALKILSNAFFGVLGWDGFRLADIDTASAITTTGQFLSFNTREFVESLGFKVIYGDTDSLFIELGEGYDYESIEKIANDLANKINENLNTVAKKYFNVNEHYLNIEFEDDKTFDVMFQVGKKEGGAAKKRYAGYVYGDDKKSLEFKAMGFELKRADRAEITQIVQKNLLDMILNKKSIDEICEYMRDLEIKFKNGEIPLDQLGRRYNIKKSLEEMANSPLKRGALNANNPLVLNRSYDEGDEPIFYYISKVPKGIIHVTELCLDKDEPLPEGFVIDYRESWNKLIEAPMEMVLNSYGITYDYIKNESKEEELNNFFEIEEDEVKEVKEEKVNKISEQMLNNFQNQMKESKTEQKEEVTLESFF